MAWRYDRSLVKKLMKRWRTSSDEELLKACWFHQAPRLIRLGKDKFISRCSCGEVHEFTIEEFAHNKNMQILEVGCTTLVSKDEADQLAKDLKKDAVQRMEHELESQERRAVHRRNVIATGMK